MPPRDQHIADAVLQKKKDHCKVALIEGKKRDRK